MSPFGGPSDSSGAGEELGEALRCSYHPIAAPQQVAWQRSTDMRRQVRRRGFLA